VLRILGLALAAALALPAAAHASVKVTFPSVDGVEPGTTVAVRIAADTPVRVALVKESASGRIVRTVERRTLRNGTFRVKIPYGRFSLRATAGGRHWQHDIDGTYTDCASATADATTLTLKASSVAPGGTLAYDFVNTGDDCSLTGAGYSLERQAADGGWARVPLPWVFAAIAYFVPPGGTLNKRATIPPDAEPGAYRLVDAGVAAPFTVTS